MPAAEIFKEKLFSKNQGSAKKAFVQTLFFVMVLAAVTSVLTVMEFQKPPTVTRVTVANPTTAEVESGSFNFPRELHGNGWRWSLHELTTAEGHA